MTPCKAFFTSSILISRNLPLISFSRDVSRGNSSLLAQLGKKIQLAQDDQQRRAVVSWLSNSVPDTSVYHVKARQRHEKTTGEWSTSSEEFQSWMTAPNSFLWLKGGGETFPDLPFSRR